MIDELTIYNLAVKYPNTIDLVRAVERLMIDEAKKILQIERDKEVMGNSISNVGIGIEIAIETIEQMKGEIDA